MYVLFFYRAADCVRYKQTFPCFFSPHFIQIHILCNAFLVLFTKQQYNILDIELGLFTLSIAIRDDLGGRASGQKMRDSMRTILSLALPSCECHVQMQIYFSKEGKHAALTSRQASQALPTPTRYALKTFTSFRKH